MSQAETLPLMVDTLNASEVRLSEARFMRLASSKLDRAYRLAGLILGDAMEAEDATQDALTRAWRGLATLRDPDDFETWFDRILVNACRDRLRRRRRIRFIPLSPRAATDGDPQNAEARVDDLAHLGASAHAPDPFEAVLRRDQVLHAMVVLEGEERAVIVLHYWSDLPLSAVAERLGWPVGTVKTRLHRALGKMRGRLDAERAGKAGPG